MFYADPTSQAVVVKVNGAWDGIPTVTVNPAVGGPPADFVPGELVVLSTVNLPVGDPANRWPNAE